MTEQRNLGWDKSSPAWLYGTEDTLLADYETQAVKDQPFNGPILDYGAGSGFFSHRLFPHADRFDIVPTPETGVVEGDITIDRILHRYGLVHARRLVSNLDRNARCEAILRLYKAVAPGGQLFIVDTWEPARQRVNDLRAEFNLAPLPAPKYGKGGLTPDDLPFVPFNVIPIAIEYYLWTRVFYPAIFGRECPFSALASRQVRPSFTLPNRLEYAVHRLLVWRKSEN